MNFIAFKQNLSDNLDSPLYLLHGEEGYFLAEALRLLEENLLEPEKRELLYVPLDAEECSCAQILEAARTPSLFGGRNLVLVKNAQSLKAAEKEKLLPYLENPASCTVLIFVMRGKADKRERFYKACQKSGREISCDRPKPRECAAWLRQQLKNRGCSIENEALSRLQEGAGADLLALGTELEKLVNYMGETKRISLGDVEAVAARKAGFSIFQLTDALRRKDLKSALLILKRLTDGGDHPLMILAMVSRQLRSIGIAKELTELRAPLNEIGPKTGLPPFLWKDFVEQARQFSLPQVRRALRLVLEADVKLKSSAQSPRMLMEALFIELCAP